MARLIAVVAHLRNGLFLAALMLSPHLAVAVTPSASPTTIPPATQIVDSHLDVWTVSGGKVYQNGQLTPSGGVILLVYAAGIVYQENLHHNWWLWRNGVWVATPAPPTPSTSPTTIPSATQIVDSHLDVWTVAGGKVYQNGQFTPSGGVILLLYAKGIVYQENLHHNWWLWRNGVWVATPDPLVSPSASPTTIPSSTLIVDSHLDVWTVSGGKIYQNGQLTPSGGVILLVYTKGIVYQENVHRNWWLWRNGVWVATSAPLVMPSTQAPTQLELDQADVDVVNWLTSNKGYLGYRYTSLAHLTNQNVHSLIQICSFDIGEKRSFPGAPLVYQGVLYTTTALSVFAIDAATCQKRWSYTHTPDANTALRSNKGPAIANGRLFRGTPDGHLIALDAANGALLWDRPLVNSAVGEYLTAVPLVSNDMVFIGKAGGELGIRGEVMALRATDGSVIWSFHTIPGPGETGSETWEDPGSFEHGGGATWTSYSLDAAAGLLLLPVGNPGPDFANEVRPGTNLFTNSIVALDALTGQLKWWHQLVGSDFHDWDTSVVASFNTADGSHLVAGAGKDGYLHVVNRATGQLRFKAPIVSRYENGTTLIPTTSYLQFCPVAAAQWNGPAFSPASGLLYMNGIDWCGSAIKGPTPTYQPGKLYLGWATPTGFAKLDPIQQAFGWINAFEPGNGRLMWSYRVPTPLVGGLIATGGNVVITGDIAGNLLILDAKTGVLLYRDNLNFGALDGGLITYQVNGKQYIAAAAGDNSSTYQVTGENTIVVLGLK
ncbi:MAG TPA: PQQ-binding-like beta-propeller repeat protein [Bryobacteraceae bacterium]|nr:PQQ-binding-like beta-propeller repeat protein [Bryobacteraceae bacterium]